MQPDYTYVRRNVAAGSVLVKSLSGDRECRHLATQKSFVRLRVFDERGQPEYVCPECYQALPYSSRALGKRFTPLVTATSVPNQQPEIK